MPGDPEALAALGANMASAAAEIERVATTLPKIASSGTWDSEAGRQFRARAVTVATGVGKTHRRFLAVATALGRSASGGAGYAARLQECQDRAGAAADAVNGTAGSSGSEGERLRAWTRLLEATGGLDPASPLPPPAGKVPGSGVIVPLPAPLVPRRPAGPFPQPRPGYVPPHLPGFPGDPAGVAALKRAYNTAVGQLRSAAQQVSQASRAQHAAADAAARAIRSATGSDGLNNVPWYDRLMNDVTGYVSAHWAGFVRELATIASGIATVCGIIAMVLAFIPGMQEFAALFETVALLAQAVAFACHVLLLATGHGSLLDVVVDGIGLVTFGVGKGLIGGAGETAELAESVSTAYKAVMEAGDDSPGTIIEAGDAGIKAFAEAHEARLSSKAMEEVRKVVSVRPVFRNAMKAWKAGKVGESLGGRPLAVLGRGVRSAMTMRSPEIGSALARTADAANEMPYLKGVGWVMSTRVEISGQLFRIAQGTGIGTDMGTRLATTLSDHHLSPPGFDSIKDWPVHGGG